MESQSNANLSLTDHPRDLRGHIVRALSTHCGIESFFRNEQCDSGVRTSSVLLLLGERVTKPGKPPEVCIILNKRSREVKQPGDLCCPGGAVEDRVDHYYSRLLALPGSPLSKWPCWGRLKRERSEDADFLALLFAAGVRESWEEMRLNPFGLSFLGPLPSQCLILFRRVIHPMVVWVSRQKKYTLSWEVERIVHIPLKALLNPFNHALHRLYVPPRMEWRFRGRTVDFPCFVHCSDGRAELLWGVTYRIITLFLETTFGFKPPPSEMLPLIPASVGEEYVNGKANGEHRRNHLRGTVAVR